MADQHSVKFYIIFTFVLYLIVALLGFFVTNLVDVFDIVGNK